MNRLIVHLFIIVFGWSLTIDNDELLSCSQSTVITIVYAASNCNITNISILGENCLLRGRFLGVSMIIPLSLELIRKISTRNKRYVDEQLPDNYLRVQNTMVKNLIL